MELGFDIINEMTGTSWEITERALEKYKKGIDVVAGELMPDWTSWKTYDGN